jgi:hypothetical protein
MDRTPLELAVLHEIVEDYEASGMALYLLIDFIHFYSAQPDATIVDIYQTALDPLKSLERKELIQFVKPTFQKLDDGSCHVVSKDSVSEALIPQILREPVTWRREPCYDEKMKPMTAIVRPNISTQLPPDRPISSPHLPREIGTHILLALLQPFDRRFFDLADAFAGEIENITNLLQRHRLIVRQTVAQSDHLTLLRRQIEQPPL